LTNVVECIESSRFVISMLYDDNRIASKLQTSTNYFHHMICQRTNFFRKDTCQCKEYFRKNLSNNEKITTSFEVMNVVVFSGSFLTIFAKGKLIHLIGWLRRPMRQAFQSDGAAIGLSVLQKLSKNRFVFTLYAFLVLLSNQEHPSDER